MKSDANRVGCGQGRRVIPDEAKIAAIALANEIGISDAARIVGVTRRSVQNWMAGKNITPEDLAEAHRETEVLGALTRRVMYRMLEDLQTRDLKQADLSAVVNSISALQRVSQLASEKPTSITKTISEDPSEDRVNRIARLIAKNAGATGEVTRAAVILETDAGEVITAQDEAGEDW